jgi:hypothetical protein
MPFAFRLSPSAFRLPPFHPAAPLNKIFAPSSFANPAKLILLCNSKYFLMNEQQQSLEALQDIRRMMERSARFISLSGLSGVCAGITALTGAWIAHRWLTAAYGTSVWPARHYDPIPQPSGSLNLNLHLFLLALGILAIALGLGFYFTWRRAQKNGLPLWDPSARKLAINVFIPLAAGGLFAIGMMLHNEFRFIAPACLIFYGLALINGSKYTLSDVRYLGLLQILIGFINLAFIGYGLLCWAIGFGVLHIIYGLLMWWKYERKPG